MAWVDCLLYDSADWPEPAHSSPSSKKLAAAANLENGLADLNWTRLKGLRSAVAQFFDAPDAQAALGSLDALEITHAPGARTQALLLAGWLGVQLGWRVAGGARPGGRPGSRRRMAAPWP